MRAVRVSEPAWRNVRVEYRKIRGMEDAVAQAHDESERKEPRDIRDETRDERG